MWAFVLLESHAAMLCCSSRGYAGLLSLLLLSGCGQSDPLNRQAVSGHVSLAAEPLQGMIEFSPVGGSGQAAGALIDAGKYSIASEKGLPPGDYEVRIYSASNEKAKAEMGTESPEAPGEIIMVAKEKIPATYNSKTEQVRTVVAGQKNEFDFEIPANK